MDSLLDTCHSICEDQTLIKNSSDNVTLQNDASLRIPQEKVGGISTSQALFIE
jgi:hypothetical protein